MKTLVALCLVLCWPDDGIAQVSPVTAEGDQNSWTLNYSQTQIMILPVGRNGALMVTLADDEIVQSISSGAPMVWQATTGRLSNTFTVRAMAGANEAPLSVLTNKRSYNFRLSAVAPTRAPYNIRMTYEAAAPGNGNSVEEVPARAQYRIRGNPELRPSAITDDGSKTYIEWGPEQALPAVFALDRLKREEMVNGYMRDDVFTIDRVYERLVFRIDRATATAVREIKKRSK
ncbi:type IV secretion system protein VirB9 [Sphingomonas sp. PP-F2F-G114-C0414]|uniref:TrbG/VirB9 family P-type conjugative transfer protein n=1 Tax=Sphingomonas sp. PP-F2F-G114-C0414 TaxID=2135662 RepID=UPI000EF913C8|nr:TrbG/VirB9 family P-type conjugative transfer protein [Sphingomonas sp. PP-F2F-G114-C0414]RMB24879.1 type IV secretion system protein VirB9 [Sphingomonas sp. PP-F2F-G114-C0414]